MSNAKASGWWMAACIAWPRRLASLAVAKGATIRYGSEVREVVVRSGKVTGVVLADGELIEADAVVVNADVSAVAGGLLGRGIAATVPAIPPKARSLSAVTWAMRARTAGFPLLRHNVFFSRDYAAEFDRIRRGALPADPTVYVCAQDARRRGRGGERRARAAALPRQCARDRRHRALEPIGDRPNARIKHFRGWPRCGLHIERRSDATVVTTPSDFDRLFPGTGGALYGPASHGWMASFRRPGARCRLPGLYLAGGSTHPGPGVPMAAISGRLAAEALLTDLASTSRSRRVATRGGMSTR